MPGGTTVARVSGFNVEVSRADADLERQARDAIRFLKKHDAGLRRLRRCDGFKSMALDFGLEDPRSPERPWPSYRLPRRLIELAGKHGIQIELTFYL
jgi:hypothetical protein